MRKLISIFCLLIFIAQIAIANKAVVMSTKDQIVNATATFTQVVQGDEYLNMSSNPLTWENEFIQVDVKNIIEISLDYSNPSQFVNDFKYSATVYVTYDLWVESLRSFVPTTYSEDIVIDINTAGLVYDKAVIVIPSGGNKFTVDVVPSSISSSHRAPDGFAPNLYIQSRIEVERYYTFGTSVIPDVDITYTDKTATKGYLTINWPSLKYAEWYDVEWTFINNYKEEGGIKLDASSIPLQQNFFRLNSTRVSVTKTTYDIPMLYESGYLIYRIRPVGMNKDKKIMQGSWSLNESETTVANLIASKPNQVFLFSGHNDQMPWQSSVVYAEEGKNKASASYFDGTLRNQQAVVKNNSDSVVIVGETKYDHQGRPAVNILPVPSGSEKVDFHPDFNLSENTLKPFAREDFDLDLEDSLSSCDIKTNGLSVTSGASQYYSPNNPDQTGYNAYLPDAKKYPFTQVQYENDNTGRIKRQSGVGIEHKLGSNHEVKFYYDVPSQRELYRLFGYEVGNSEKYRKQTVIDANGQATVSYLDPQGRVIATAFKGKSPENVEELANVSPANEPINLIGKGHHDVPTTNEKEGYMNLNVQKTFVETDIERSFDYNLTIPTYNRVDECEDGTTKENCFDCVLDLEVSIKDDCGVDYANGYKATLGDDQNCSDTTISQSWVMNPDEYDQGSYGITKKLKVNEDKLREYWDQYISDSTNCIKTPDDFISKQYEFLDTTSCSMDCDICLFDLNARWTTIPDTSDEANYALYLQELKSCEAFCEEVNFCLVALTSMITDMAPYGQYGKVSGGGPLDASSVLTFNDNGDIDSEFNPDADFDKLDMTQEEFNDYVKQFPLSIFNTSNDLPKHYKSGIRPSWRYPREVLRNTDGTLSTIVVELIDGDYSPQLVSNAVVFEDPNSGVLRTSPLFLKYVKDFISVWESSWAKAYVEYHPEYPLYKECVKIQDSYVYDERLRNISYQTAAQPDENNPLLSYLVNGGAGIASGATPAILTADPFFYVSDTTLLYKVVMDTLLHKHPTAKIGIAEMAHGIIECPNGFETGSLCAVSGCPVSGIVDSDEKWFAYVGLYNTAKQFFVKEHYTVISKQQGFYNGCIGNKYYDFSFLLNEEIIDPSSLDFDANYILNNLSYAFFQKDAPCGIKNYEKYKKKTPRFPLEIPPVFSGHDAKYCTENDLTQFAPVEMLCEERFLEQAEAAKKVAQLNIYNDCGLCPVASDLQSLLGGMFKFGGDSVIKGMNLSCGDFDMPVMTKLLKTGMGMSESSQIAYQAASHGLDANNRYFINSSITDGSNSCAVELRFNNSFITGGNINSFDPKNISDLCCMSHLDVTTILPGNGSDKTFSFTAYYKSESGDLKKIYGEGRTSCLNIAQCTFDPVCSTTQLGVDLQNVLTMLSTDFPTNSSVLIGTQNLDSIPYKGVVSSSLQSQVMNSESWSWSSSLAGNILSGTFASVVDGNNDQFNLIITKDAEQTFEFSSIKSFSGLRADNESINPNTNYLINVLAYNTATNKLEYFKVKLNISGKVLPLVKCTQTVLVNQMQD